MSVVLSERDRNVIPRWRDFHNTAGLGELDSTPQIPRGVAEGDLTELVAEWQRYRTISFAGDLISSAIVGCNPGVAREAAEFIVTSEGHISPGLKALAERIVHGRSALTLEQIEPLRLTTDLARAPSPAISFLRRRLIAYPNDAILWMDLALLYAIRGVNDKAERAVRVAMNLAPSNRFVLRSAARFFIHRNRSDIAHELLLRSPALKVDPWLMSAEIAVAMSARRSPSSVFSGASTLSSGNFAKRELSELSSALGTLELRFGSSRKARKLVRQSLEAPNDNSLAQAEWISRRLSGVDVDMSNMGQQIPRPYEAQTFESFQKKDWASAIGFALQWLKDQPFSTRPAHFAAYIASTIEEKFALAEQISLFGLMGNPQDPGLRVNLAYGLAKTNRLEEAETELARVSVVDAEEWVDVAIDANHGLLAFRRGVPDVGRDWYGKAVLKASRLKDMTVKFTALWNWTLEEIGVPDSWAERLLEETRVASGRATGPDTQYLLERLENRVRASLSAECTTVRPSIAKP